MLDSESSSESDNEEKKKENEEEEKKEEEDAGKKGKKTRTCMCKRKLHGKFSLDTSLRKNSKQMTCAKQKQNEKKGCVC